jgi:heat shock protein HslJ
MAAGAFSAAALALACAACTSIVVDQRTFAGTRWRVTGIDGRPAPATQEFIFEFTSRTFGTRMGCNHASGVYRVEGGALVPAGVVSTEMACEANAPTGIPLMTYEDWGFRVLRAPMHMQWSGQDRVTLTNANGSIALERLP